MKRCIRQHFGLLVIITAVFLVMCSTTKEEVKALSKDTVKDCTPSIAFEDTLTNSSEEVAAQLEEVEEFSWMFEVLDDLNHTYAGEMYTVEGCWKTNAAHTNLWRARYNLFKFLKNGTDEGLLRQLNSRRNPKQIATILFDSLPGFAEEWKNTKRNAGIYHELIRLLLSYNKKIHTRKGWKGAFDSLLNNQVMELNRADPFYQKGFPASNDKCMCQSSSYDYGLESWCYGFWIRRYHEGLFPLVEMGLMWVNNMLDNRLEANDTLDFIRLAGGRFSEKAFQEEHKKQHEAQFNDLKKTFLKPEDFSWDGPVYAGQYTSLLVNQECDDDDSYTKSTQWYDTTFFKESYGLEPGMVMSAIYPDGRLIAVQLTNLSCLQGECRGNWWAVGTKEYNENDTTSVSDETEEDEEAESEEVEYSEEKYIENEQHAYKKSFPALFPTSVVAISDNIYTLQIDSIGEPCENTNTSIVIPDSSFSVCKTYRCTTDVKIALQLFRFSHDQGNGWSTGKNYVRIKSEESGQKFGNWVEISKEGDGLYPIYIIKNSAMVRILFSGSEGISGPAYEIRMLAKVRGNEIVPGRIFNAGGQPCD